MAGIVIIDAIAQANASVYAFFHPDCNRRPWNLTRSTTLQSGKLAGFTAGGDFRPALKTSFVVIRNGVDSQLRSDGWREARSPPVDSGYRPAAQRAITCSYEANWLIDKQD